LTNLANRVQPVVRHDIGDRLTVRADPCECGNPLPAVGLEGRQNDVLVFSDGAGRAVRVPPMGLVVTVGATAGIESGYQLVQTGPSELSVRIAFRPDAVAGEVWEEVARRLKFHLRSLGLPGVDVVRSPIPPGRDARTGKLRKIWSELPLATA
jgi:phenylacetate-coenzyme A ligase PaaK-like adenylate-forming protein